MISNYLKIAFRRMVDFPVVGVVALFLAMITVSVQTIKAAIANPVKSLRTQ